MNSTLIILAVILFMLAAFIAGWQASNNRERLASRYLQKQLHEVQTQKRRLTEWVRANWPDEFEAYRRGHQEGYQQGVSQAADLEAET